MDKIRNIVRWADRIVFTLAALLLFFGAGARVLGIRLFEQLSVELIGSGALLFLALHHLLTTHRLERIELMIDNPLSPDWQESTLRRMDPVLAAVYRGELHEIIDRVHSAVGGKSLVLRRSEFADKFKNGYIATLER